MHQGMEEQEAQHDKLHSIEWEIEVLESEESGSQDEIEFAGDEISRGKGGRNKRPTHPRPNWHANQLSARPVSRRVTSRCSARTVMHLWQVSWFVVASCDEQPFSLLSWTTYCKKQKPLNSDTYERIQAKRQGTMLQCLYGIFTLASRMAQDSAQDAVVRTHPAGPKAACLFSFQQV